VSKRPQPTPARAKASTQRPSEPNWDWKKDGLLFPKDIEDALKLRAAHPALFKVDPRAQNVVAYSEQLVKWYVVLNEDTIRAFASRPLALQDLSVAGDRKRKPKERLAAIDRFVLAFGEIPNNVAIALFNWLHAKGAERETRKSKLIEALSRTVWSVGPDSRTGHLVEVDGRGAKKSVITRKRIVLAAQRLNQGIGQSEMATELFPNLRQEQAYARTRDLFLKNRYLVEVMRHRLQQHQPQSSPKSRR